ncbi:MAG: phytanoyl-CoA dioxygenase family protein [Myxococcota bacterium]
MSATASSLGQADAEALTALREQGYWVFEHAYSPEEVAFFRDLLMGEWDKLGRPALAASPPVRPADNVEVGPAGIIFHGLSSAYPQVVPRLYKPNIIATMRGLLGEGMRLELPAGVLSDETRPFFDWHTHIDGVDDAHYDNKRPFSDFETSARVTHLLYLDDLDEDNGPLLVLPRKITDPTPPPYETTQNYWPGQVEINCPAGSVVVIEQCTWHAAYQKKEPGIRAFVGSYFRAAHAPATPLTDPKLAEWDGDDPLFASLVGP